MKFSLVAFVVSTPVLLSFIALNVDSNTSPDDFTTITAPLIEIDTDGCSYVLWDRLKLEPPLLCHGFYGTLDINKQSDHWCGSAWLVI
ncbi:MAG: hypothetical protein R3C53_28585 [Pirellulaceae bacterium]